MRGKAEKAHMRGWKNHAFQQKGGHKTMPYIRHGAGRTVTASVRRPWMRKAINHGYPMGTGMYRNKRAGGNDRCNGASDDNCRNNM